MKKPKVEYSIELDPNADYKMAWLHERDKENYESLTKWLYLGADIKDREFAKVGLTMDDLSSRSYSSANPHYFLFCAFKCRSDITKAEIENIERNTFQYLEREFSNEDGTSNRATHTESGRLSECFYNINFEIFFISYHDYLLDQYRNDFMVGLFENEFGDDEGDFILCEFNPMFTLQEKNKYTRMILR